MAQGVLDFKTPPPAAKKGAVECVVSLRPWARDRFRVHGAYVAHEVYHRRLHLFMGPLGPLDEPRILFQPVVDEPDRAANGTQ